MKKGRPVQSIIRKNVVEILHYLGKGYGYQIAKIYNELFPAVTQRSVYYHLRKGIETREIKLHKIEQEAGDFSWGTMVQKVYYILGPEAAPQGNPQIKEYLEHGHQISEKSI